MTYYLKKHNSKIITKWFHFINQNWKYSIVFYSLLCVWIDWFATSNQLLFQFWHEWMLCNTLRYFDDHGFKWQTELLTKLTMTVFWSSIIILSEKGKSKTECKKWSPYYKTYNLKIRLISFSLYWTQRVPVYSTK